MKFTRVFWGSLALWVLSVLGIFAPLAASMVRHAGVPFQRKAVCAEVMVENGCLLFGVVLLFAGKPLQTTFKIIVIPFVAYPLLSFLVNGWYATSLYFPSISEDGYYPVIHAARQVLYLWEFAFYIAGFAFMWEVGKRLHRPLLKMMSIAAFLDLLIGSGHTICSEARYLTWLPEWLRAGLVVICEWSDQHFNPDVGYYTGATIQIIYWGTIALLAWRYGRREGVRNGFPVETVGVNPKDRRTELLDD